MKKIVVAIPHSHAYFWLSTCMSALHRFPPVADGYECEVVVVNNSPWSPAINGVTETILGKFGEIPGSGVKVSVLDNYKSNRFHASALDCVAERYEFDLLMALETDVIVLRPDWLQWFVDRLKPTDFAAGHFHHEQFVNPSCTIYRGEVVRQMAAWCKTGCPQDELRWGPNFDSAGPLDNNLPLSQNPAEVLKDMKSWIGGPFAEKRGFHPGTTLKESPSGQLKGPGWYEPGQQLHAWAVNEGWTYTITPTATTSKQPGMPIMTFYGDSPSEYGTRQLEYAEMAATGNHAVHLWGGTRALDIIKHDVTCNFVASNTGFWLEREARLWRDSVPADIQQKTLELIRRDGWYYRGAGTPNITDRDRAAVMLIQGHYSNGGVKI